jgi:hypothetical protein
MAELPTGTVTLLFSDIEGSTRLLQRSADRYASALMERRLLPYWRDWGVGWNCFEGAHATCQPDIRRYGVRSPGVTICWSRQSRRCSGGWRYS